jgi:hypothetical protein
VLELGLHELANAQRAGNTSHAKAKASARVALFDTIRQVNAGALSSTEDADWLLALVC